MSLTATALRVLDEVQSLAQLDGFAIGRFAAALGDAGPAGSGARLADVGGALDGMRGLFAEIDRFAQKAMRIRLHHLTDEIPAQLRTLVATTIVAYEHEPALLRERVAAMLARIDGATAQSLTQQITAAAEKVLATRAALRQAANGFAQRSAQAWLPAAERAARDRSQAEEERDRWDRARVDLERIAARGETLEAQSFAERLDKITPPAPASTEPEEEVDATAKRFSLLELD